jgi:CubicO group peptidase (beta-lactamase class C family)
MVGMLDEHGTRVVSCGTLDNGSDQEANGDTVFGLHSMTGTFTCLLLQDMIERGEMEWDDPVAKYLPKSVKVPTYHGKEITLRHLVTETSGLPDFRDKCAFKRADNPFADFTVEKMYAFISGCELTNDPGTKHFHGGVDKGILGQAMALKAGTNYESLVLERICRPLKMDSTRFTLTPELKARLVWEHNRLGYASPSIDWAVLAPLGGLFSTANDLLKFVSANLGVPVHDNPGENYRDNLGESLPSARVCVTLASISVPVRGQDAAQRHLGGRAGSAAGSGRRGQRMHNLLRFGRLRCDEPRRPDRFKIAREASLLWRTILEQPEVEESLRISRRMWLHAHDLRDFTFGSEQWCHDGA